MDSTTKQIVSELLASVQRYMTDKEVPYNQLPVNLRRFNDLAHDAPVSAKEVQILLGLDAVTFTQQRTDGTLPPLEHTGFYKARTVRELLKQREEA